MEEVKCFAGQILSQTLGTDLAIIRIVSQGGGCINEAARVVTNQGDFFIKWNEARYEHMFSVEAKGLALMAQCKGVSVPQVLGFGSLGNKAYLVLEFLEKGRTDSRYWGNLGEGLAALHLQTGPSHGLDHDNYIGRLDQGNTREVTWLDFFVKQRLKPQLKLATTNGYVSNRFVNSYRAFLEKLPDIMPDASPSLLHGDLWNGNVMPAANERAMFFDPAVYFGAREMDLAMTRLFGGFDQRFYEAYDAVFPIPKHFEALVEVYNLYPLMVHVNLFGPNSGYVQSVDRIVQHHL